MLVSPVRFWPSARQNAPLCSTATQPARTAVSGSGSVVEHHLAKVRVVGSNPIFRSRLTQLWMPGRSCARLVCCATGFLCAAGVSCSSGQGWTQRRRVVRVRCEWSAGLGLGHSYLARSVSHALRCRSSPLAVAQMSLRPFHTRPWCVRLWRKKSLRREDPRPMTLLPRCSAMQTAYAQFTHYTTCLNAPSFHSPRRSREVPSPFHFTSKCLGRRVASHMSIHLLDM